MDPRLLNFGNFNYGSQVRCSTGKATGIKATYLR